MISWFKKDLSENILVLHIDSGGVGIAFVYKAKDLSSEIIYKTRVSFSLIDDPKTKSLEPLMLKALEEALIQTLNNTSKIFKQRGLKIKINRALVTLSSPWVVSNLNILNINEEKPFVLDSKMILEAIHREEEVIRKNILPKLDQENEILESSLMRLRIDGYKASLPIIGKVKNVQIDFITNILSKELIRKIEDTIIKTFSFEQKIFLQGFMFAYFKVLSHVFQHLHSSLLVNISDEVTEILFIEHNHPKLFISFPFGPISSARLIADKLKLPLPIAESYLELFISGVLDLQTETKLEPIINSIRQEWKTSWKEKTEKYPNLSHSLYAVFLSSLPKHHNISKFFLENVLSNKNVIILGQDNKFTSEIIKSPKGETVDEDLAIACFYDTI